MYSGIKKRSKGSKAKKLWWFNRKNSTPDRPILGSVNAGDLSKKNIDQDPVIAELEKFMEENTQTPPLKPPQTKPFDTCKLLDILGSMEKRQNRVCKAMPIRKRAAVIKPADISKKLPKVETQTIFRVPKRKLKIHHAEQNVVIRFFKCSKIEEVRRRKATERISREKHKVKARILPVHIKCDSKIHRNVVIKKEVIDLTDELESFVLKLNFGKQTEVVFETCSVLMDKLVSRLVQPELHTTVVFVPDLRFCGASLGPIIDLTDEQDEYLEKYFASAILPIIYKCHRVCMLNQQTTMTAMELADLNDSSNTNYFALCLKFMFDSMGKLGLSLIETAKNLQIKYLDIPNFLEELAVSLKQKYNVVLPTVIIQNYIELMLYHNSAQSNSHITNLFQSGGKNDIDIKYSKECEIGFTERQLEQLRLQIEQYHDIGRNLKFLMDPMCDFEAADEGINMDNHSFE